VVLAPGATAHAGLLVTTRAEQVNCTRVTVEELRIALPGQARPAFVPAHIPVCSQEGQVSLSVQAIQARPGVPGFTVAP